MTTTTRRPAALIACALAFILSTVGQGAEIYSNAIGGGPWTDTSTWKGGVVPGPEDDVVLARDDVVTFNRNDDKRVTCRQLMLDPRSVLQFKQGAGPIVLTVNGPVESYGTVKLDATRAAADRLELRFVNPDIEQRTFKTFKGGGLIISGRTGLPKGAKNALVRSVPPVPEKQDVPFDPSVVIEVGPNAIMDVQRTELENIYLQATTIDNTGARPGERVNITRNHFIGTSRLLLTSCDTPLVADNLFEREAHPVLQEAAIRLTASALSEIRGNTVRGAYPYGIHGYDQPDSSVTDNLIENCESGVWWYGDNAMIKNLTIRNCPSGLVLTSASGAVENVLFDGCRYAYYGDQPAQFTNMQIKNHSTEKDAYHIYLRSGPLTLVNCDIQPEQIVIPPTAARTPATRGKPQPPLVQTLNFFVAKIKGPYPQGILVDVRTNNPMPPIAAGALDPNVRNSPTPVLSSGYTPFPRSLEPIILRGWSYDSTAKLQPAPEYQLRVLAPVTVAGRERNVIKSVLTTPHRKWFRADPNDKEPTLEVTLP